MKEFSTISFDFPNNAIRLEPFSSRVAVALAVPQAEWGWYILTKSDSCWGSADSRASSNIMYAESKTLQETGLLPLDLSQVNEESRYWCKMFWVLETILGEKRINRFIGKPAQAFYTWLSHPEFNPANKVDVCRLLISFCLVKNTT